MTKHTAGPWEVQNWKAYSDNEIKRWICETIDASESSELKRVCAVKQETRHGQILDLEVVVAVTGNGSDSLANAYAIAAVPVMLDRLNSVVGILSEFEEFGAFDGLDRGSDREKSAHAHILNLITTCKEAIAKAKTK